LNYLDEPILTSRDENNDDSNENRISSSTLDVHRGDDFYKKLMFYEKNASTNHNNSPRRSSFIPSTIQPLNGFINKPISSRSNYSSNINEQMHRSKSYKDLLDPPISHSIYYQQHPSPFLTPIGNGSGLTEYQRRQLLSSNNNFVSDDISSSSTGHLPKPPPGIPSQNAR